MRPFFATCNNIKVLVVNSFAVLEKRESGQLGRVRFLILNYTVRRDFWQLIRDDGVKFEHFASDEEVNSIMDTIKIDERKNKS